MRVSIRKGTDFHSLFKKTYLEKKKKKKKKNKQTKKLKNKTKQRESKNYYKTRERS